MNRTQIAALIVPTQRPLLVSLKPEIDPLGPIAGKSIYSWIVDAALAASARRIGIVAPTPSLDARSELADRTDDALIAFITPTSDVAETLTYAVERLGTELTLRDSAHILILPAESPQIDSAELRNLVDRHVASGSAATLLAPPSVESIGEPLVVRNGSGQIVSISEHAPVPTSVLCIRASLLTPALHRAIAPRWQNGPPLAEIVGVLAETGHVVEIVDRAEPIAAIDSTSSRVPIEMFLRDRIIAGWIDRDVAMPDPRQVAIDATVTLGKGVQVLPGTVLEGATVIGDGAILGPNSHIVDSVIGSRAVVPHSVVRGAEVSARAQVPPFSVL